MKAGRLLSGEMLATPSQVFCKLDRVVPQEKGVMFNFMVVAGEGQGQFVELSASFEGVPCFIEIGNNPKLLPLV